MGSFVNSATNRFYRRRVAMKSIGLLVLSLAFLAGSGCGGGSSRQVIQNKGSDTLVNLVQILAENYMETFPDAAITVTGGGSGVGIAALINGTVDIANHSRPIKDKEYKECEENGIDPITVVIGIDGLSVIVNEKCK